MSTTPPFDEDGADRFIKCITLGNQSWMSEFPGNPPVNGSAKAVVLTCMDSRIPPLEMLGLSPGEVFIVRNAGNAITHDALRSLLICLTVMDCRQVLVVGHSSCGMRSSSGIDRRLMELVDHASLSAHLGLDEGELHDWFGFYELQEVEWTRLQVDRLREVLGKVVPGAPVRVAGAIYHLDDGRLELL